MDKNDRILLEHLKEVGGEIQRDHLEKYFRDKRITDYSVKNRAQRLTDEGLVAYRTIVLEQYRILPKGERALWPFWKRIMFELVHQHGWEIFKWIISFIAGGGALALVKWLLDKIPS